jgi:uncharacterized protein
MERKTLFEALDWPHASLYAGRGRSACRESDMTPEERQMLGGLFQRVNAAAPAQRDPEAESFINDAVRAAPHAPYVLAQTVLVQQQALEAAAHRLADLEAAARQGAEQSQEHGSFLGNLGKTIFGGGPSAPPRPGYDQQAYQRPPSPYAPQPSQGYPSQPQGYPPPPPQGYPPQPGPWGAQPQPQGGGGGFLQNAASTATGVAGGVVLGNLLGGLFGGHGGGGLFGGGGASAAGLGGAGLSGNPTEVTEINNYYDGAKGDGAANADFQGFDPGAPGVQDANFDQLDDSSFDGSDGSSFDDSGGGFDDV